MGFSALLVFDWQGNAKVFTLWNERQDWLHVSYFCISNYRELLTLLWGKGNVYCNMKCKNCGKEIPEDSTFCPNCGKPTNNIEKSYRKIQLKNLSLKSILVIIAIGIWMLVLQNLGIIPVTQDVRVKNTIDADVSGSVYVDGGTISVE